LKENTGENKTGSTSGEGMVAGTAGGVGVVTLAES